MDSKMDIAIGRFIIYIGAICPLTGIILLCHPISAAGTGVWYGSLFVTLSILFYSIYRIVQELKRSGNYVVLCIIGILFTILVIIPGSAMLFKYLIKVFS